MPNNSFLYGIPLIENKNLIIPAGIRQKKTHKFKLINWIFAKLYGYESVFKPDPNIVFDKINRRIYGHPETLKKLIETGGHQ